MCICISLAQDKYRCTLYILKMIALILNTTVTLGEVLVVYTECLFNLLTCVDFIKLIMWNIFSHGGAKYSSKFLETDRNNGNSS